jgi:hypothetical protein
VDTRIGFLPKASIFDPAEGSEGSLDPLGLAALADALASRLASDGVRERQSNIRFLTFCCVGWSVIAALDPELRPGDRDATLEQAFEWIVLESLVSAADADGEDLRIPGILKASDCLARGLPMNSDRYLRTPGTFGFFGVYRSLATYLKVVGEARDGQRIMRMSGERILEAWRLDQGIPGFSEYGSGPGREEYRSFVRSLSDTWAAGKTEIRPDTKRFIRERLVPGARPGRRERSALWSSLKDEGYQSKDDNRRQLLAQLQDPEVRALFDDGNPGSERRFHRLLRGMAQGDLPAVLDAIEAFEAFSGFLMGGFDALRRRLTGESRLVELAAAASGDKAIREAAAGISAAYSVAESALEAVGLTERFIPQFSDFALPMDPVRFAEALIERHARTQKGKPPAGKAPWFETDRGRIGLRPLYRLDPGKRDPLEYLYAYRGRTLCRFAATAGEGSA